MSTNDLAACIQAVASRVTVAYELHGHEWQVTVTTADGQQLTFVPSQLPPSENDTDEPPRPSPAAVVSALWGARMRCIPRASSSSLWTFGSCPLCPRRHGRT